MLIWGTMAYARTRELVHGIDHPIGAVRHYAYIAGSPHPGALGPDYKICLMPGRRLCCKGPWGRRSGRSGAAGASYT